jgi:hypothetical protein
MGRWAVAAPALSPRAGGGPSDHHVCPNEGRARTQPSRIVHSPAVPLLLADLAAARAQTMLGETRDTRSTG